MAMDRSVITLGVADVKISKLTADTATALTYDAPIDIPGIKEIKMTLVTEEKELTGDGVVLATSSKKKSYDVSFSNATFSSVSLAFASRSCNACKKACPSAARFSWGTTIKRHGWMFP